MVVAELPSIGNRRRRIIVGLVIVLGPIGMRMSAAVDMRKEFILRRGRGTTVILEKH